MNIGKAAVLGAGTMGAGIAAHLANAGIKTLLLDIAPREEDAKDKNQIVKSLFEAAKKLKPAPFMLADNANLIELGNFEDDLHKIKDCDFVIEAVVENLEIKHKLFAEVENTANRARSSLRIRAAFRSNQSPSLFPKISKNILSAFIFSTRRVI
jgi:3-hydroxyacyl-CoA dehydrogenase